MTTIISVPLKKTDPIDMVKVLQNYIKSTYDNDTFEKTKSAIDSIHEMRNVVLCRPVDKHEASLDAYSKYYMQFDKLDSKIKISESQANLKFTWYDPFDKGSIFGSTKYSLSKGSYEKICVLFNIGALSSQIASVQPTTKSDSLKQMARYYQLASGIFTFLMDMIPRDITILPTHDLSAECLLCLSSIMIAQAQESYYLKACLDNMKHSTLAKISMQLADCFLDSHLKLQGGSLKNNWFQDAEKIIVAKSLYYKAMAEFHQSIFESEEKNFANNVSRLEKASSLINEMNKKSHFSDFKYNADKIVTAYNNAKKENDTVYLLRVPKHDQLTPIGKAMLAKEIVPLPENISPCHAKNFIDLFAAIVPLHICEFSKFFEDYKKLFIQDQINCLRDQNNLIHSILASLNLPAAIESITNSNHVPQSLIDKCLKVRQIGGEIAFISAIDNLKAHFSNNSKLLLEIFSKLDEEERDDNDHRVKFGSLWRKSTSVELTKEIREELDRYNKYLVSANKADDLVRNRFSTFRHGIVELSMEPANLSKIIPHPSSSSSSCNSSTSYKLKQIIDNLNDICSKREELLKRFNEHSFNVTEIATKEYLSEDIKDKKVISEKILQQQYGMLIESESKLSTEQDKLCSELQDEHNTFVNIVGLKEGEREIKMKQLAESFDVFIQLQAHLSEGNKFYNDLNEALLKISNKVNDFICARQIEKSEIIREIQISNNNLNSGSNYQLIYNNSSQPNQSIYYPQTSYNPQNNSHNLPPYPPKNSYTNNNNFY